MRGHNDFDRRDFDREHAAAKRRIDRTRRTITVASVALLLLLVSAGVWLLANPEAFGSFVGRIAAGFDQGRGA